LLATDASVLLPHGPALLSAPHIKQRWVKLNGLLDLGSRIGKLPAIKLLEYAA
jgi:hypothetical protein